METPPSNDAPRLGKLDLKAPPPGRFLYRINGAGPVLEGRVLDRFDDDHTKVGEWLKLAPGLEWISSNEVWVVAHLPELERGREPSDEDVKAIVAAATGPAEKPAPPPPPAPEGKPEKAKKPGRFSY